VITLSQSRIRARRAIVVALTFVAAEFLIAPQRAAAHAELTIQLDAVTLEIQKDPNNAELYVRRGQLRREHLEFELAGADFDKAEALAPTVAHFNLLRGKLYLDWGWPLTARACLDLYLAKNPSSVDALVLRARVLQRLSLNRSAVNDYDLALDLSAEPSPDLFIERSQMLMNLGNEHWTEALRGLDEGIKRLGPLVTLQLFAIDAEVKQQRYDGALARVNQIAERSPRKETWYARRAEILVQAGRPAEARKAYEAALAALNSLPPARRNVPAMAELARRIQREIESLPK
jgi:tetratricopeptide (TPR) repeat protein